MMTLTMQHEYSSRQEQILWHLASIIDMKLPEIAESLDFYGTGFQRIPYIRLNGSDGSSREVVAHIEGGYWIAKMHCEPEQNYDAVIRRLLLVKHADEVSGKARYVEVSDFVMAQLLRIYFLYKDRISVSSQVWNELEIQLLEYKYATYHEPMSENHKLLHLSSEVCMAHHFPDKVFCSGLTGKERLKQVKHEITVFLEKRLKYGWGEFDSTGYYNVDFAGLLNIYDFQPDEELRKLAWKSLHFMIADLLHHSINGYVGGARGRVKISSFSHCRNGVFWPLFLCTGYPEKPEMDLHMEWSTSFFATSRFLPLPEMAMLASARDDPYEVKERNLLYTIPDDPYVKGSLKRYNYVTSHYVLGSIIQRDEYEPQIIQKSLSGVQELSWSLVMAGHPEAVVFSGHPGHQGLDDKEWHGYWTGDTNCLCQRFVQDKSAILGLHAIHKPEQLQWIHFYIPKHAFDQVREQYGWLLLQCGDTIAAIKPEPGYYWTSRGPWTDKEIIVPAAQGAFALELFDRKKYQIDDLLPLLKDKYVHNEDGIAKYTTLAGEQLELQTSGSSLINGIPCNYSDYPKFQSRYIYSCWGSTEMRIHNDALDIELTL